MTTIKVLRNGDTLGLTLPPDLIERLALHEGDEVSVTESNGRFELRKTTGLSEHEREAIERVLTRHARTFELLANR